MARVNDGLNEQYTDPETGDLVYWAALDYTKPDQRRALGSAAWSKIRRYYDGIINTQAYLNWTKALNIFYSIPGWYNPFSAAVLGRGGDQGQNVSARINITGSMARSVIALLLQYIPEPVASPVNTDTKTLEQTSLVQMFMDKYVEEKGIKKSFADATKYAEIYGMAFQHLWFDPHRGEFKHAPITQPGSNPLTGQPDPSAPPVPVMGANGQPAKQRVMKEYKDEGGTKYSVPQKAGDICSDVFSPLDVPFDLGRRDSNFQWLFVPEDIDRYELAAWYPEAREDILRYVAQDEKIDVSANINRIEAERHQDNIGNRDLLRLWHCYHARTEAVPDGLYCQVLGPELLFVPGPLPYSCIPVIYWEHGHIDRSPFGDSLFHQCLGLQDSYDDIWSSIISNITAFSKQLVMIPRTAGFSVAELTAGLAALEYDETDPGMGKPEGLQLVKVAPEAFKLVEESMPKVLQDLMGLNQATRGSPPPSWSGTLNEQVKQMALSYQNEAHNNMLDSCKKAYNLLLEILQNYIEEPIVTELAGIDGTKLVRAFTKDDFRVVRRVDIKLGEAFLKDNEAKLDAARELGRLGLVDAAEFLEVMSSGSLDAADEDDLALQRSIKSEEESIIQGGQGDLRDGQPHLRHLSSHLKRMGTLDPTDPQDLAAIQRMEAHVGATLQKYRQVAQMAPELLQALHEPPPASMAMQGAPPPNGGPGGQPGPSGGQNPGGRPPSGRPGGPTTATGEATNANPESGK